MCSFAERAVAFVSDSQVQWVLGALQSEANVFQSYDHVFGFVSALELFRELVRDRQNVLSGHGNRIRRLVGRGLSES
jgi:hypothetical protein